MWAATRIIDIVKIFSAKNFTMLAKEIAIFLWTDNLQIFKFVNYVGWHFKYDLKVKFCAADAWIYLIFSDDLICLQNWWKYDYVKITAVHFG